MRVNHFWIKRIAHVGQTILHVLHLLNVLFSLAIQISVSLISLIILYNSNNVGRVERFQSRVLRQ